MENRAQDIFVARFLDWGRVEERLRRYSNIAETFPMDILRRGSDQPYGVHYLAWRLGVWGMEALFVRFNELLAVGGRIPGWEHERSSLVGKTEYATFFSLVWQLQVAEFLLKQGWELEWQEKGADLRCRRGESRLFVECYQRKGAHSVELFLDDVLSSVGNDICVEHSLFRVLNLPQHEAARLIDTALRPFLSADRLAAYREAAKRRDNLVLFERDELRIYLRGGDPGGLGARENAIPHPVEPIRNSLQVMINSKARNIKQFEKRPNLLAVNTLLSDAQLEGAFEPWFRVQGFPQLTLPEHIDAVAYSPLGIDGELTTDYFNLLAPAPTNHPVNEMGLKWAGEHYLD